MIRTRSRSLHRSLAILVAALLAVGITVGAGALGVQRANAQPAPEDEPADTAGDAADAVEPGDEATLPPTSEAAPPEADADPDVVNEPAEEESHGAPKVERTFVGSVQFDYMLVPTEDKPREQALDGATVELSLKLAMDFGHNVSANVKMCVACHGVEVGMAFFDLRVADELNVRIGRFTPAFGEFPLRHDPANHRTSDKPLPYDMGRMLRLKEWNMSVLPAPWVDNGIEINGTHFFGDAAQIDYAAYLIGGPKGANDAFDVDYKQSRSGELYYVDNNSKPSYGGRVAATLLGESWAIHLGASGMAGKYDPEYDLRFMIGGVESFIRLGRFTLRGELLVRRTEMFLGDNPAERFKYGPGSDGKFDPWFLKQGFYGELEVPIGRFDFVLRGDGLRRIGNVPATSELLKKSAIVRYTAAASVAIIGALRLKLSGERYDFSDFQDETVVHVGMAGPF